MKRVTRYLHSTMLVALLQPAPETLELFDDIMVLSSGKVGATFIALSLERPGQARLSSSRHGLFWQKNALQYMAVWCWGAAS